MARSEYAGKIDNSGNQEVKAPYKAKPKKPGNVKEGKDLRIKK